MHQINVHQDEHIASIGESLALSPKMSFKQRSQQNELYSLLIILLLFILYLGVHLLHALQPFSQDY